MDLRSSQVIGIAWNTRSASRNRWSASLEMGTLEDEALDDWLDETEDKILGWVAWWGHDQPLGVTDIARSISENHVVTQHYVDRLVRRGFLHEHLRAQDLSTYSATPQRRAYLVEERMV